MARYSFLDLMTRANQGHTDIIFTDEILSELDENSPSPHLIHQATMTLTDAQIKTLPTIGVQIEAAPGPNKISIVIQSTWLSDFSSAYTNIDATFCGTQLTYGSGVATGLIVEGDFAIFGLTGERIAIVGEYGATDAGGNGFGVVNPQSTSINQPIMIETDNNGAGNFTGGHASNSLIVSVVYVILDTTTGLFE